MPMFVIKDQYVYRPIIKMSLESTLCGVSLIAETDEFRQNILTVCNSGEITVYPLLDDFIKKMGIHAVDGYMKIIKV